MTKCQYNSEKNIMNEFSLARQQAGLTISQAAQVTGYTPRTVYRWENNITSPRKAIIDLLHSLKVKEIQITEPSFRFIDLFAGIGGMRQGFDAIGGKCVFTSEWNKYSVQTYMANFECDHEIAGDITKVDAQDIPQHDVLLAGFPCQPFSIAGVSKKNALNRPHGFRDTAQGTLFFDLARIIEHHQPKAFLLENVKNLVNHDKGNTFRVIYGTLTKELGYHITWKVIDGSAWTPQHRERILIVGFREKNNFSFDSLEIPATDPPRLKSILHPEDGSEIAENPYTHGEQAQVAGRYTLSDRLWDYLQKYAEKHRLKGNGFGFGLVGAEDVARTLSARYYKDGSEILIRRDAGNPRRLTPRECARLMGFDQPGQKPFQIPVSDTQAYKQFGNAVVVPVIKAVAKHMLPWIIEKTEPSQVLGEAING